jgi:hypothetical protein
MEDNILELWKRLHRTGRYYDKPIRYTEFADQFQELVEQQVFIGRKQLLDFLIDEEVRLYKMYGDDSKICVGIKVTADAVRRQYDE